MKTPVQQKIILFSALFMRIITGWMFFGSVDLTTVIHNLNLEIFSGNSTGYFLPYFPVMPALFWFGAIIGMKTPLPFAFGYKIVPLIFDSLIALLIFDIMTKRKRPSAFKAAMLYALSPLCLLVTCIHFQWDALPLFFLMLAFYTRDYHRPSLVTHFLCGLFFACSLLLKPIALIFLPLLISPRAGFQKECNDWLPFFAASLTFFGLLMLIAYACFKFSSINIVGFLYHASLPLTLSLGIYGAGTLYWIAKKKPRLSLQHDFNMYITLQGATIVGFCTALLVSFSLFIWFGFDLIQRIEWILRYMNQGVQVFGLPFAYPFNSGLIKVILKNRFWLMGLISIITVYYYTSKINTFDAILYSYALVLGFSGLGCQYLLWVLPFLLISNTHKLSGIYNFAASTFLTLYCAHPFANPIPYQNTGSFVPLKSFKWLAPPEFFTHKAALSVMHIIGNYLIPFASLTIAAYGAFLIYKNNHIRSFHRTALFKLYNIYTFTTIGTMCSITTAYLLIGNNNLLTPFIHAVSQKLTEYAYRDIAGRMAPLYGPFSLFNGVTLILALSLAWSIYAMTAES